MWHGVWRPDWGQEKPQVRLEWRLLRRVFAYFLPYWSHALVVLEGALTLEGAVVEPGRLAYLRPGREHLRAGAADPVRALLVGGEPFAGTPLMWWNFVARTRDEVDAATREWNAGSPRFGGVASPLARIPAPLPPW